MGNREVRTKTPSVAMMLAPPSNRSIRRVTPAVFAKLRRVGKAAHEGLYGLDWEFDSPFDDQETKTQVPTTPTTMTTTSPSTMSTTSDDEDGNRRR